MQRFWRGTVPLKQPGLNGRPNWRFGGVSRRIVWTKKCRREERKEEVGDWVWVIKKLVGACCCTALSLSGPDSSCRGGHRE